jgi:dTMP kinase
VFVTFEGTEGSGKTTALAFVADRLRAAGESVRATREPGSGPFGPKIRALLLEATELDPVTELFLFLADRAQHVEHVVRPALARGEIVLCDRFSDSTIAYQGYARRGDLELLRRLNELATGGLAPDLTLLFDLDPAIGLRRLGSSDRLDREPIGFHEDVRRGFLAESKRDPGRWRVLDATAPAEVLGELALMEVTRALEIARSRTGNARPSGSV